MEQIFKNIDQILSNSHHSKVKCTNDPRECEQCHKNMSYISNLNSRNNCYKCNRLTRSKLNCCDRPLCYICYLDIKNEISYCKNCSQQIGFNINEK